MHSIHRSSLVLVAVLGALSPWSAAFAQSAREPEAPFAQCEGWLAPPLRPHRIGGPAEERERTRHLLGTGGPTGFLLRSANGASGGLPSCEDRPAIGLVLPEVQTGWNSSLPFSLESRAAWEGRGLNFSVAAGAYLHWGPVFLVARPEAIYSANRDFQTIPYPDDRSPERDPFASPWYGPAGSMDLPMRPGTEPIQRLGAGQSVVGLAAGPIELGVSTESLWWGPGVRNAIVMSDHAPGIPHAFLRTGKGVPTPAGEVEGAWILGRLEESDHFDSDAENDRRTLSAFALVLRPAPEADLSVGVARAVFARLPDGTSPVAAAFDAFRSVGRPNSAPRDTSRSDAADQITSLFARWIFPRSGFETYVEWARFEQPASLRDLLTAPQHSQGFTVGLQWARPLAPASLLRLQVEHTDLEPSPTFRQRPLPSTYASRAVEQGYTHRGQVIGAGIGPGASGQWLAVDHLSTSWQLGAFVGRVRWHESAHLVAPPIPDASNHDLSIFGGLRGAFHLGPFELDGSLTHGVRFNYLFQTRNISLVDPEGVDIRFTSLSVSLSPASR